MYRKLLLPVLALAFAGCAHAQEIGSDRIAISEDEQALVQTLVLDAPVEQVWAHFTTSGGISNWMAPVAEVDLRTGGSIRSNYDACAAVGDAGTITLEIVNLVPERMLLLRSDLTVAADAEWMTPAIMERGPHMANLIEFEALDDGRTQITSWGLGYGTGEEWETMIGFFTAGNEWSFTQLARALAGEQVYPGCGE